MYIYIYIHTRIIISYHIISYHSILCYIVVYVYFLHRSEVTVVGGVVQRGVPVVVGDVDRRVREPDGRDDVLHYIIS